MSEQPEDTTSYFEAIRKLVPAYLLNARTPLSLDGFVPLDYEINGPLFWDQEMGMEGAHDYKRPIIIESDKKRSFQIQGGSLFFLEEVDEQNNPIGRIIYPGCIQVGRNIIMPRDLMSHIEQSGIYLDRDRIVGVTGIYDSFGVYPNNIYAAAVAAILSAEDLQNKGVLDLGAGTGIQTMGAARGGANRLMSVDLPSKIWNRAEIMANDLRFNLGDRSGDVRSYVLERDIVGLGINEVQDIWQSQIDERLPEVAIINIGPSYDNGDIMKSPSIEAINMACELGVEKIILGGYNGYYRDTPRLTRDYLVAHHELATDFLYEFFREVETFKLPGDRLCMVARR